MARRIGADSVPANGCLPLDPTLLLAALAAMMIARSATVKAAPAGYAMGPAPAAREAAAGRATAGAAWPAQTPRPTAAARGATCTCRPIATSELGGVCVCCAAAWQLQRGPLPAAGEPTTSWLNSVVRCPPCSDDECQEVCPGWTCNIAVGAHKGHCRSTGGSRRRLASTDAAADKSNSWCYMHRPEYCYK